MEWINIVVDKMKLFKEDGKYYLHGEYTQKDDKGNEWKITIPKIYLGLLTPRIFETKENSREISPAYMLTTDDYKEYPLKTDRFNKYVYFKQTKFAVKEMTISEIEEKLGHKIKIVSEELHGTNN